MSITRADGFGTPRAKLVAFALLRALRSTAVIALVAVVIFGIRRGGLRVPELKSLLIQNRTLLVVVFFGVLIWDQWFQRAKSRQAHYKVSRD